MFWGNGKRLVVAVCLFLMLLLSHSPLALAHIFRESNGVTAELHIPPNDKPVAAQPTLLELSFEAATGKFVLSNYHTTVSVVEGGKQVQTVTATPVAADQAHATVTFPEIGSYQLVLRGTAKSEADPNFTMTYPAHVATTAASVSSGMGVVWVLAGTTVLIIVGVVAVWQIDNKKRRTYSN